MLHFDPLLLMQMYRHRHPQSHPLRPPPSQHNISLYLLLLALMISIVPFIQCAPQSMVSKSDCVDLICPAEGGWLRLLEREGRQEELLDAGNAEKVLDRCRTCADCTHSGYSVCVHRLQFDAHTKQLNTDEVDVGEGACECAHSGPAVLLKNNKASAAAANQNQYHPADRQVQCRMLPTTNRQRQQEPELNAGEALFRVCYASALRKLPIPKATNDNDENEPWHPVLVTVDQFWLSDYWHALNPSRLRLIYLFPVDERKECEGEVLVPNAQDMMWINSGKTRDQVANAGMQWLCKASLHISMNGVDNTNNEEERESEAIGTHNGGGTQSNAPTERGMEQEEDYYDDEDPDMPPEVQFERDVFVGSSRVRFYYELHVRRDNFLKSGPGHRLKFEQRDTLVKSDTLDFNLHPEIYGTGRSQSVLSSGNGTTRIDRVNIERKGNGDDEHAAVDGPREPIVRPAGKLSGKLAGGNKKTKGTTVSSKGTSEATATTRKSMPYTLSTPSIPLTNDQHQIDGSTEMPSPPALLPSSNYDDENGGNHDDDNDDDQNPQTPTPSGNALNAANEGDEVPEEDWLLLRNIVLGTMFLLTLFLLVAICYKRRICCFAGRGHHNSNRNNGRALNGAGEQRNGKTRVANGKHYRETSTTTGGGYSAR